LFVVLFRKNSKLLSL